MSNIEVYCDLPAYKAIDTYGENIGHILLRARHIAMAPLLRAVPFDHWSKQPDGKKVVRRGQVVTHHELVPLVGQISKKLIDLDMPTGDAIPISQAPNSSDAFSMAQNRTVMYRPDVIGNPDNPTAPPSVHSYAAAIDIAPLDNPIVNTDHTIEPKEAIGRLPDLDMVFMRRPNVVHELTKELDLEMEWGGRWNDPTSDRYYGVDKDGNQRHILFDPHHLEVVPEVLAGLEMPSVPKFNEL